MRRKYRRRSVHETRLAFGHVDQLTGDQRDVPAQIDRWPAHRRMARVLAAFNSHAAISSMWFARLRLPFFPAWETPLRGKTGDDCTRRWLIRCAAPPHATPIAAAMSQSCQQASL